MARKTLTDTGVAALKPKAKPYTHPDPQCVGHYVRVSPTGNKSFLAVVRDPSGKQKWITIGNVDHLDVEAARKRAREIIVSIKDGRDHTGPQSFETVSKEWLKRHCEARGLITTGELRRCLTVSVWPTWGGRDFVSLKRSDIASLLDKIQDESGPTSADKALTIIGSIFSWYAARHDDYNSPIVRGMRRTKPKERARDRILTDDEVRHIWSKCEGAFGDIVKLLLLSGQRRSKVAGMRWAELSEDCSVWNIANGNKRQKGTGGELVLPQMAIDVLREQPRFVDNPFVFHGAFGKSHYKSYDQGKTAMDNATGPLPRWTLHDLRRTARSLMSRAGVRPDIAERVLGHVPPGVQGVYDRHAYREEKALALSQLAGLIGNILRDDADKKVRVLRG
jgi:integrase